MSCTQGKEQHMRSTCLIQWVHTIFSHPSAHPGTYDHPIPEFWFCSSLNCLLLPTTVHFIFCCFLFSFSSRHNVRNSYFEFSVKCDLWRKIPVYTINEGVNGISLSYLVFISITFFLALFPDNSMTINSILETILSIHIKHLIWLHYWLHLIS